MRSKTFCLLRSRAMLPHPEDCSPLCCCSVQPLHQRSSCDQGVITTLLGYFHHWWKVLADLRCPHEMHLKHWDLGSVSIFQIIIIWVISWQSEAIWWLKQLPDHEQGWLCPDFCHWSTCPCSSTSLPSIPLPFWVPWQGYTSWHCRALWNPLHGSI